MTRVFDLSSDEDADVMSPSGGDVFAFRGLFVQLLDEVVDEDEVVILIPADSPVLLVAGVPAALSVADDAAAGAVSATPAIVPVTADDATESISPGS